MLFARQSLFSDFDRSEADAVKAEVIENTR